MKQKRFLATPMSKIIAFLFVYLCLGYTLAPLSSSFYQRIFHCSSMNAEVLRQYGFFIFHLLCMSLGILIFHQELKNDLQLIKNKIWKSLGKIILTFILMLIGSIFLSFIQTENQAAVDSLLKVGSPLSNFLFMLTVSLIGPFNEELFFREVMIGQFSTNFPKWILILISSFLFGLIHISSFSQWPQALPYIWNGWMLSLLYSRNDNNILLSFGGHALNNFISILI